MLELEFNKLANQELNYLLEQIESQLIGDNCDIDLLDGILYIKLKNSSEYVINKHGPSKQIWLSSPISGGLHFAYSSAQAKWISSSSLELREIIAKELGITI